MNLKNRPPIFVPFQFQGEIERLSKAALMDVAWDMATRLCCHGDPQKIMTEFRSVAAIIIEHRKDAA